MNRLKKPKSVIFTFCFVVIASKGSPLSRILTLHNRLTADVQCPVIEKNLANMFSGRKID
jgi:hypothetical protein